MLNSVRKREDETGSKTFSGSLSLRAAVENSRLARLRLSSQPVKGFFTAL
jgi:hypothetical protein